MLKFSFTVFVLAILILCKSARQACQPFGTRLSFGQVYYNSSSKEKLGIRFNTNSQCKKSYVQIKTNQSNILKVYCSAETISVQAKVEKSENIDIEKNSNKTFYNSTVHHCSIEEIQFETSFFYNAYGWEGKQTPIFPYKKYFLQTSIINPFKINQQSKFIFLGDWGKIYTKKYQPLDKTFDQIIQSNVQIDGVVVLGDIGYDLDTNKCQNYQDYLIMASQISQIWPTIYVTGNHQYKSSVNNQLYVKSFVLYELDTKFATFLTFGNVNFLLFDPYFTVYKNAKTLKNNLRGSQNLSVQEQKDLQEFKNQMKKNQDSNVPTIAVSHYPIICSGDSDQCVNDRIHLANYFDLMSVNKIGFYIGAHHHSYQRSYPYISSNKTFLKINPPYLPQKNNYLVNLYQGAAGNDVKIIQKFSYINNSTASYTENVTGLGILAIQGSSFKYAHISTENIFTQRDMVEITLYPSKSFSIENQKQIFELLSE